MQNDTNDLLDKLKQNVAARRIAGDYPPELEQQLDSHYHQILRGFDFDEAGQGELQTILRRLNAASIFDAAQIKTWSPNPFKRILHHIAAKLTVRQTNGILQQCQQHAEVVNQVIVQLLLLIEEQTDNGDESNKGPPESRRDINRRLSAALDRLNLIEAKLDISPPA